MVAWSGLPVSGGRPSELESPLRERIFSGPALAVFVLAWAIFKVFLKRLFNRTTGLPQFRAAYDGDRLPPYDSADRALLPRLSGCLACGRCDVGEGARMAASNGSYPGLMAVVLACSRSTPDFDAAARVLASVPESSLREREGCCPANVPFVELARFVARRKNP